MRKVTFGGASSLDNFIARLDNSVDWLKWGPEAAVVMKEYWKSIDTMVMGRKTWDVAMATNPGGVSNPGIRTYLCSRTLTATPDPSVELSADAVMLLRQLRKQKGKDICVMGGGELAAPLLEAGLIDEIGLNVHPVLLGAGVPLFHHMAHQLDLELLEARPFKNGCVLVRYRVKRRR